MQHRESRIAARRRIFKAGVIEFGDAVRSEVACTVRSISETGAGLILNSPLWFPDTFTLVIDSDGFRKPCRAVWRKENRVGVTFIG
ncbi:putative pyridoxine 5'-phosphate oxidase superfamily flavin-nucleotide-binding protein [Bradyrhizobium sp. USDA 4341]